MCVFFDELVEISENRGEERGKEIGKEVGKEIGKEIGHALGIIEMGYRFNHSERDIIEALQDGLNIELEKAQEYLEEYHQCGNCVCAKN